MIDVAKIRKALACMAVEDYDAMSMVYGDPVKFGADMGAALDELEAMRAPVAPVDIEGVAEAGWRGVYGGDVRAWGEIAGDTREVHRCIARAVLAHVGRVPVEPRPAAGVAITEAHVEEAAIRAYCAPPDGGESVTTRDDWPSLCGSSRAYYINEARAVLEYAADRFSDGPALAAANREIDRLHAMLDARHPAPTVDPRAERLTRYRCAAPEFLIMVKGAGQEWSDAEGARRVEEVAHAMLAAERTPDAR